jgi:hypothetical protein
MTDSVTVEDALKLIAVDLKRIADRLESWDTVYTTQTTKREIHSLKVTANVYSADRR